MFHTPQKLGNIEGLVEELEGGKVQLPEPYPFKESREFFKNPEVGEGKSRASNVVDREGCGDFLSHTQPLPPRPGLVVAPIDFSWHDGCALAV